MIEIFKRDLPHQPTGSVLLIFENDNKFFGLWNVLGGDEDDLGRTHGTLISITRNWDPHNILTFQVQTDLFTRRLPQGQRGPEGTPIHFNEFNSFSIGIQHHNKGTPTYYRFVGGVWIVNQERITPGASGQQKIWHDILRISPTLRTKVPKYDYQSREEEIGAEAVVEATFGLQKEFFRSKGIGISAFSEVSHQSSSLTDWIVQKFTTGVNFSLTRETPSGVEPLPFFLLSLLQEMTVSTGQNFELGFRSFLEAIYRIGRTEIIMRLTHYDGTPAQRVYRFQPDSETTMSTGIRVYF